MKLGATLLMIALSSPSWAQQSPPPGATSCTGCHGLGEGAPYPIEQMKAEEIEVALAEFRNGARGATVMDRIARGFNEAESAAIAEWFANQQESTR